MSVHRFSAIAVVAVLGVGLAGCTSGPAETDGITIVASTNVWGDVAASVAGDLATVTSLITSPAQDPHSFEASARDQLAISKADLIITNGGGYDPFMATLIDAAQNHAAQNNAAAVIDASATVGVAQGGNEHVWYSFEYVDAVARSIADELATVDDANAAEYRANYAGFAAELDALGAEAESLKSVAAGQGAAITEPVPLYLLEAVGLVNKTPEAFSEAFEEGIDIPPTVLRQTIGLFAAGEVSLLAYNEQTSSVQSEQVRRAAVDAGVAVIPFAETLPDGQDYVSWMSANLALLAAALTP